MAEIFSQTLLQMLRIFGLIALGFFFAKRKVLPEAFSGVISQAVTKLFLPMLTLYTFMNHCTLETLVSNGSLILYGTIFVGLAILIGFLLAKRLAGNNKAFTGILRYAIAIPNTGTFLTPITLTLYGTEGYYYLSLCLFSLTLLCYSWGIMQLIPNEARNEITPKQKRAALLKRIFSPTVVAMLIGIVLGLCGANQWMPPIVSETVKSIGDCYTVLALLLIGFTIADYSLKDMLPNRTAFWFVGIRMLLMPVAFLLLMKAIRAPYYACYFALTAYACPCGMNAIVYPVAYGQDCKDACALVLFSSLVSVLTIPLLYSLIEVLL